MSHLAVGRPIGSAADSHIEGIALITGWRPETCPWRAWREPIVQEVVRLHRAAGGLTEGGAVPAHVLAADPPSHVWHGLAVYETALAAVVANDRRIQREERTRRGAETSAALAALRGRR